MAARARSGAARRALTGRPGGPPRRPGLRRVHVAARPGRRCIAGTLSRGLVLDGGLVTPRVTMRKRSGRETHLPVELVEGRNREIRRLCAASGHEVTRLLPVSFGGVALGPLPPGRWRRLTYDELRTLRGGADSR